MKKIATLAVLPVIALASCSKDVSPSPVNNNSDVENTQSQGTQNATGEILNENISSLTTESGSEATQRAFEFSYEIGGNTVPVKGKFTLENNKITGIIVDGVDLTQESPLASFAKNVPAQIVGKELKGLKIDTVSGASYVTVGFNKYLSTLQ